MMLDISGYENVPTTQRLMHSVALFCVPGNAYIYSLTLMTLSLLQNYSFWLKLFHIDEVHASPLGSYLQACVVYHTLYGRMPPPEVALRQDMSNLWLHARRMQPDTHRSNPFPTLEQARYLYNVADRVCKGHLPKSFTMYENGEASDYVEKEYD